MKSNKNHDYNQFCPANQNTEVTLMVVLESLIEAVPEVPKGAEQSE